MKVAYHFKCTDIRERYDRLFYKTVFNNLLSFKESFISTKILVGDLLIYDYIHKSGNAYAFLNYLFQVENDIWRRIIDDKVNYFVEQDIFVICFETISKEIAAKLHNSLLQEEHYLGAYEIDNSVELHWWLYGECIGAKFRILNKDLNVFIDNDEIEQIEYAKEMIDFFQTLLFDNVNTELSNYRYSLFDDKHNYENAKRAAEWKKGTESLFATITDEIIAKLTDTAPDLTDKLWAINQSFLYAQAGEQYAQAMTSCRRVFEYVTDCLFPATNEVIDGHSLKKDKYKNRLIEFANRELRSETNIDLIVANTVSLFDEWNKLYELSNKGVHTDPHRQECRRCILRTILLLDDLIAIKRTPFQVNVKTDELENDYREKYEKYKSE
ncbi:MAG: hypothetical protein ACLURQ_19240 [Bacteroides thetaiotaomicron]